MRRCRAGPGRSGEDEVVVDATGFRGRPGGRRSLAALALVCTLLLPGGSPRGTAQAAGPALANPILFVTQVPVAPDFTTIGSVFGNQLGSIDSAFRGGDLYIRYPDGTLKSLTQAAGFGNGPGQQGAAGIAVRDPSVHWNGQKALFSMVVGGATKQYEYSSYYWQIYEITGLGQSQTPVITKVANQPDQFNNVTPTYGTDDKIIFTSDRPRDGQRHLYPQRDEYEEAPTVTGLWSLDPSNGNLFMLNHTPSGAFTPSIDSFGRLIFTRWDHLQRDQQADSDAKSGGSGYGTFNFSDESANAQKLNDRTEIFPEPRGERTDLLKPNENGHTFNDFAPWQINEDGTEEETLNHIGRHELLGYFEPSFENDPNLKYHSSADFVFNKNYINGMIQTREDGKNPGSFYGIDAPEFSTHASGQIVSLNGAKGTDADHMAITYVTHRATASYNEDNQPADPNNSGHYRDPLGMTDGTLIAAHTIETRAEKVSGSPTNSRYDFRLKTLKKVGSYYVPDQNLTPGITKSVSFWSPDSTITYNGPLWELQPVEVRSRTVPQRLTSELGAPEMTILNAAGITVSHLKAYLTQNNLALAVSRNVTTRDINDKQQPFNLRVVGGTQTLGTATGKIYDIKFFQFLQGDLIRGLGGTTDPRDGRRVLAQYMHDPAINNPPAAGAPQSSVLIGADGSMAAFVPARRALTWQMTDASGNPVVRERYWLTMQPGEIRVCGSCHGTNTKDQAGNAAPQNPPEALATLLGYWKNNASVPPPATVSGIYLPGEPVRYSPPGGW